ncbi:hypothetical protein K3N28_05470 [Glycomyces sp. TRM65418]|uniref:hypothetical protein n=1 Tax=Glycomyces sp. TRM65418 TaxID=2867006 RepID=UPI001CE61FCA|nr:hypothetical protein [Glycomyces sp. TRM65418]MCC3762517.1 hypothetical protein [Glycomyces sp. TRM65418]QZD56560.1 hypothetical protein K3N28_05430 [Glycomyces sp. TRM65418]
MRKITATAAFAAAGVAVLGAAASPAMAQNSGVTAGDMSLVNLDASDALHWQICGQNVLTQSFGQNCDNRDHIGEGPQSHVHAGDTSAINADASSLAHWQICGQNVLVQSFGQVCDNSDHISDDGNGGFPDKGADQGDY